MGSLNSWRTSVNGNGNFLCSRTDISSSASQKRSEINVVPEKEYQEITGFGGAFNEIGWEALKLLDASEKSKVLEALFGQTGCKLNMGRTPIGASDFALDEYSLDDVKDDFEMKHFSIDRDKTRLIPYIKEALKINPEMKIWGCPWSPPFWMKTTGEMCCGGELLDDNDVLKAYALYFDKYVKEYAREGVKIFAICIQNETDVVNVYPTSSMPAELMAKFIRSYLIPRFVKSEGKPLKTEIWAGTIRNLPGYADTVISDPVVRQFVKRIGYQYSSPQVVKDSYVNHPGHTVVHTESPCHNGANSWPEAAEIFNDIVDYLENGCSFYTYWNMILNETTLSSWNWKQNSMINIDRGSKKVKYNYEYYIMKHFSHFITPGAKRIEVRSNHAGRVISFRNPDGGLVCILNNPSSDAEAVRLTAGSEVFSILLEADSIYSLSIKPDNA